MNITPVNNYNNKVSFRHLLPGKNIIREPEKLDKIFQNPEIKKFVEHYHQLGTDITLSEVVDKYFTFSRQIILKLISGKLSFKLGEDAFLHINKDTLDEFNAEKAIQAFDEDYNEKLNNFLSWNKGYAMFDEFNRDFK